MTEAPSQPAPPDIPTLNAPPAGPLPESATKAPAPSLRSRAVRRLSTVRPYLLLGGALLGVVLLIKGSIGLWYRYTGPSPPLPDLNGADPLVAKAVADARVGVERDPGSAEAWGLLGKVLRAHEFELEANACFRRAETLDPSNPRWPYFWGRGLRMTDPDQALACLQRAVERGGPVMSPRLLLGELLVDRGRMEEAEALFRVVLEKEPESPRALLAMGRIALGRNQLDKSLDYLQRSAAGAPKVKATHSLLAQVYNLLGQTKAAEEQVRLMAPLGEEWFWNDPYQEEVVALWVGQKARLMIALDYWMAGRREEAVQRLQAIVADYPESAKAQFMLGDKLNVLERFTQSEKPLREAIRLDSGFSRSYFELGFCLQKQGKSDEAGECYLQAIRLQPDYALAYHNLSFCLEKRGDRRAAIQALQAAVRYKPDVAKAHRHLGKMLAAEGQFTQAREALQRAVDLASEDPESKALLEWVSRQPTHAGTP
jgi:tetratricopeptide (TPR) repeat protein